MEEDDVVFETMPSAGIAKDTTLFYCIIVSISILVGTLTGIMIDTMNYCSKTSYTISASLWCESFLISLAAIVLLRNSNYFLPLILISVFFESTGLYIVVKKYFS